MKKRIIAIALTLALTAAMAVPASAATITEDSDSQSGTTTLSIGVQPSYSVIIPPSIDAVTAFGGAYSASQFVTARDVQLAEGDVLVVDLSSDFKMTLQGGTDTLDYTMTAGTGAAAKDITAQDPEVARFSSADEDQSVLVSFTTDGLPTYAGTYTDTVTFSVSVETPQSTQPGAGDEGGDVTLPEIP